MTTNRTNLQRAGALWVNHRPDGSDWLSGQIELADGIRFGVMLFPNTDRTRSFGRKKPAYIVMVEPDELARVLAELEQARQLDRDYSDPF